MRLRPAAITLFILELTWAAAGMATPALGPVRRVTTGDPYCQKEPIPTPLRSGGFAVGWNHYMYTDVKALLRVADADGHLLGPEVAFPGRRLDVMGSDVAGHLAVVWQASPEQEYRLQRLSATGQPLGPEVELAIGAPLPWRVSGAVAPDGSIALVWQTGERIAGRWFSAQGLPLGPEFEIDRTPLPSFARPAAVIDTAGRLVAAWIRPLQAASGSPQVARFRRFDTAGNAAGPVVEVSGDVLPAQFEWSPSVAPLRDGGIAVSWQRSTVHPTDLAVWLRRFDAADKPVEAPVEVEPGYSPRLTSDGGDRLALAWEKGGSGQLRLLSGLSGTGSAEPAIALHPELLQGDTPETPAVAFLATGRLAAVWQSYYIPSILPTGCENLGIFERVVSPATAYEPPKPAGREVLLGAPYPDPGFTPEIALKPGGGWVAVWQAGASGNGRVVSRSFDAAGNPQGSVFPLNVSNGKQSRYELALAALAGGGFAAAWVNSYAPGDLLKVLPLKADGLPAGAAIPIPGTENARNPRAAAAGPGFLLTWHQGPTQTVFARRFHADGTPAGPAAVVADSGQELDLAALPGGGFLLAWAVRPSEVFVRRLDASGTPAGPPLLVSSGELAQGIPQVTADVGGGFAVAWATAVPPFRFASSVSLRRFGPDGLPREEVIEIQALQDIGYEEDRSLYASDLSASPDGVLFVLLDRGGDFRWGLSGLAVVDGVPVGPPVTLVEGKDVEGSRLVADGCGWIAGWNAYSGGMSRSQARRLTGGCQGASGALTLGGGRFRAEILWRTPDGKSGTGRALPLTDDTGAFWFFAPDNLELMLKVLDGRGVNGAFWVFYATLTDVAFDLLVTDTLTGERKVYSKPAGRLESRADVGAFPVGSAPASAPPPVRWLADAVAASAPTSTPDATAPCVASETALCLASGRFRIGVRFVDPRDGVERQALSRSLTPDSGAFWFFAPENLELMLKIVDGRPFNNHFWFFFAGLSDVEYEITVTDTQTGVERVYSNPRGTLASRADTSAF